MKKTVLILLLLPALLFSAAVYAAEDTAQELPLAQPWPENGEIRRDIPAGGNTELIFEADQAEDTAMMIRICQGDAPVSFAFIGGKGKVSVLLPAGTYSVEAGCGARWYGIPDAFGPDGYYEVLTLGPSGERELEFRAGLKYTLTLSTSPADSESPDDPPGWEGWNVFIR